MIMREYDGQFDSLFKAAPASSPRFPDADSRWVFSQNNGSTQAHYFYGARITSGVVRLSPDLSSMPERAPSSSIGAVQPSAGLGCG